MCVFPLVASANNCKQTAGKGANTIHVSGPYRAKVRNVNASTFEWLKWWLAKDHICRPRFTPILHLVRYVGHGCEPVNVLTRPMDLSKRRPCGHIPTKLCPRRS